MNASKEDWNARMARQIGTAVRKERGELSAAALSDRTAGLGMRVSRSALSELENGKRRTVSVAELLVLAAALGVPPVRLLFPQYPDGTQEYLPERGAPAMIAAEWVAGEQKLRGDADLDQLTLSIAEPIGDELVTLAKNRRKLSSGVLEHLAENPDQGDEIFAMLHREISSINDSIRAAGGVVDAEG